MTQTTTTDRDELYSLYSDLFKEANGLRPRWSAGWSCEKFQKAIDGLYADQAYQEDFLGDYFDELDSYGPYVRPAARPEEFPTEGNGWSLTASVDVQVRMADRCNADAA